MDPIIASLICSDIISGIVAIGFSLRAVGRWVGRWVGIKVGSFLLLLVRSCRLITPIKCLKGHKSLRLLLKGVL